MISNEEYIGQLHAEADALAAERNSFRAILCRVRDILETPEDVDVATWAAQVAGKARQWDAVPVAQISRWVYDYQTVDDERAIIAWIQARDAAQGER